MARLHHVLFSLAALYYPGGAILGQLRGDAKRGGYLYDDGSGNRLSMAWSPRALVGVVFDHESDRSEYDLDEDERRPLAHLAGLPRALGPLAKAAARDLEDLVTSGFWAAADGVALSDPGGEHGLDLVGGMFLAAEEAVFGNKLRQSWLELSSLGEAHARLAVRAPGKIAKADQDILLSPPPGVEVIELDAAKRVRAALAEAGIAWTIPKARILAMAEEKAKKDRARVEAALGPDERALFDAARADDAAAIERLAKRGVALGHHALAERLAEGHAG